MTTMAAKGRVVLALLLCVTGGDLQGQERVAPPAPVDILIRATRLWTGEAWVENALIGVGGGKVQWIRDGKAERPMTVAGTNLIDLGETWVLPGLVLADGAPAGQSPDESVTPTVRAADAYDPFDPDLQGKASGVTARYLSPGRDRLVPGFGGVARVGSPDPLDAIVEGRVALHVVLTEEAYDPPEVFVPSVPPGPDNLSGGRRPQLPRTRAGAFAALRDLLVRARRDERSVAPDDPDLGPLRDVLAGRFPLRVRAERAADIRGVLEFAKEFDIRLVIEGGTEAWRLADDLAAARASVVLRSGVAPGSSLQPASPFASPRGESHPDAAAILQAAGVPVALVPPVDGAEADLLWYAAQSRSSSVRPFSDEDILRAVTSGAAEVLGLGHQVGKVAAGRSADLCVYDRDPLRHPEARPVIILSRGAICHDLTADKDRPVAIFAKEIHTGLGETIHDGVLLVLGKKIVGVGKDVVVPPGARRVRAIAVTPGFVDAGSQVGIRSLRDAGDGEIAPGAPLPASTLNARPTTSFDPRFPDVAAAARSGVTTVALSPMGGEKVSGVVAVVKTSGEPGDASIIREVGGVYFDYAKVPWSTSEVDALRKLLEAGKKYAASWKEYESKLAKWKEANPAAARKLRERKLGEVQGPTLPDAISGTWEGDLQAASVHGPVPAVLSLRLEEDRVRAILEAEGLVEGLRPFEGKYENGVVTFEEESEDRRDVVTLTPRDRRMILVWDRNGQRHVTGLLRRVSAASVHPFPEPKPKKEKEPKKEPEPKKDEDKKPDAPAAGAGAEDPKKDEGKEKEKKEDEAPPKAPRKDLALEPYRPLLTADIPLFIGLGNPRLARDLLEVARNGYEVTTVVTSAERYTDLWERMAELGVGYSPTGSPVEEDGAERRVLALEAIRRRIPVALRSGPDGDARTLYAAASHAVRCGVPSTQGLQMITRWSALVLGLQDRIGSLAEGMDADLVLLTGTPFAPGSRVERVMIDGRFLDEPVREVR